MADINIHAPHKPEGLLPLVIQSLFINCKILIAVLSTFFALFPKLNLLQNLRINNERSIIFILLFNPNNLSNLIYKQPMTNTFILKTSEKSINKCSVPSSLQAKYNIAPTIRSVFLP